MASLLSAAQRRRLEAVTEAACKGVLHRERLRDRAKAWATIEAACVAAKIDPAQISGAWPLAGAEKELARLDDTLALQRADAAFAAAYPSAAAGKYFGEKYVRRAAKFAGRPPPGAEASLADWYCWSLAALSAAKAEGASPTETRRAAPASVSH